MISLQQVKERKIVQWTLAYAAAAWLALQLAQFLWGLYNWAPIVLKLMPVALGMGFFVVIILAWFHGEKGEQRVNAIELAMLTGILIIAGAAMYALRTRNPHPADVVQADTAAPAASVAVLPFKNFSSDKEQDYFSDGITEEILNAIAQNGALQVAARTSSFAFKNKDLPVDQIGAQLHVANVLEGSVQKAGERLRITAQLINAKTGYHIWSQTFDRDAKDVFAVQDEIARNVAEVLRVKLAAAPAAPARTISPAAHEEFLLGLSLFNQRGVAEDVLSAIDHFERAIQLQPDYADAYALEAGAWSVAASYSRPAANKRINGLESLAKALPLAKRALELNPNSAEAHATLGVIATEVDHDWEGADQHFDKAIQLNPSFSSALVWKAESNYARDPSAALEIMQRALTVDPLSPVVHFVYASALLNMNRLDESKQAYNELVVIEPKVARGYSSLLIVALLQNDSSSAFAAAERGVRTAAMDSVNWYTAHAYFHPELRGQVMARLRNVRAVSAAIIAGLLRDRKTALKDFAEAIDTREGDENRLVLHPALAWLRNDPEFQAQVARLRLPTH